MPPKISIIIPIYKVELFIRRCAESLMQQTLREGVEFIFVDDATPDSSMDVLNEVIGKYPNRTTQVRILTHSENRGLPAARNTGLEAAHGEYIFHCDSDDFLEPDAMEQMLTVAEQTDADMVWTDWYLSYEKTERYMQQPSFSEPLDAVRAMLGGTMKYNVWNKLVRRSLYTDNNITFPTGRGMGEDMTIIMLAACAKHVAYIPQAYYHYVKLNGEAFTGSMNQAKVRDILYNVNRVSDFLTQKIGESIAADIDYFKLNIKFPWLISADGQMYRLWRKNFKEADAAIFRNPYMPLRNKVLQWMAKKRLDILLKLYYLIFYKIVYTILYH